MPTLPSPLTELLGVLRVAGSRSAHPQERRRARSRLFTAARKTFDPDGHLTASRDSDLFPTGWRRVLAEWSGREPVVRVTTDDVIGACPWSARTRPNDRSQTDHIHLCRHPSAVGSQGPDSLCLPVNPSWSLLAGLVAVANAGCLDPYRVLILPSEAHGEHLDQALALAWHQPRRIGVAAEDWAPPTSRETEGVERLLGVLDIETSKPWRVPTGPLVLDAFLGQGLRSFRLEPARVDSWWPGSSRTAVCAVLGALCAESGLAEWSLGEPVPSGQPGSQGLSARIVPMYLPQFHPTASNDEWWGTGFTEWTNVTTASPVFDGHVQPFLPADLGFYDVRLSAVRSAQLDLAEWAGLSGFMYYTYWFAGVPELDMPMRTHSTAAQDTQLPFCLLWANESWSRTWDGTDREVLRAQDYDQVPAARLIDDLIDLIADPLYLGVDGRPVLAVYRPASIPDLADTVARWRAVARDRGLDLFLMRVDLGRHGGSLGEQDEALFDGFLEFPPHPLERRTLSAIDPRRINRRFRGVLFSYQAMVDQEIDRLRSLDDRCYPGLSPGWDNTARRQFESMVFVGANPYSFHRWLLAAVDAVARRPAHERLIFVNAWNEWAEGAVLEPSRQFGRSYLLAVRAFTQLPAGAEG